MKNIAFSRVVGHSRYPYKGELSFSDGMPTSAGGGIDNLLERYNYTGNKGNVFHGEAPSRIFDCNRMESCYLDLATLYNNGWSPSRINKELCSRFDLVVLSMANYIKPGKDPGVITKIIDMLEVDFIVLGLGMQEAMPYDLDLLHPNLARLLFLCNEKAKVFSVRGEKTEHWLKKVGLDKAIALGCPSLFVYPQNIMNLTPPDPEKVRTALTGGYISDRAPRSYAIVSLFEDFKAHYVMQQEMFVLKEFFEHVDSLYNDATGEVEKELLNIVLENIHGKKMPFESYRWFQDPHAWRVFASQADFYLGDRFHGGVAALQAGVPSLIIAEDLRVHELTDFFKIPNITFKEIHKTSVKELVAKYLSAEKIQQLRQTYYERFLSFKEVMCKNGIQLAVSIEDTKNDIASVSERASAISKPRIIRRIISKFT